MGAQILERLQESQTDRRISLSFLSPAQPGLWPITKPVNGRVALGVKPTRDWDLPDSDNDGESSGRGCRGETASQLKAPGPSAPSKPAQGTRVTGANHPQGSCLSSREDPDNVMAVYVMIYKCA